MTRTIYIISWAIFLLLGCGKKMPVDDSGIGTPPAEPYATTDCDPSWSPDGTTIAYAHHSQIDTPSGIFFINPDGSNKRLFLESVVFQTLWHKPDWSPDGKWLVVCETYSAQIYKIRVPEGDSLTKLTSYGRNFFPTWSSNGIKIAWSISTGDSIMGLWIMNADSSNKKRLYPYGMMPDWLTNNASIVYIGPSIEGSSTSTGQIWIMDTLGNNKVRITNFNISNRYPKIPPNGSKIVFSSQATGQGPRIWVVNSDGTSLIKLTETGGDHPAWSPDGTKIVYCNTVFGRLWTMNSDGSNKKQLTTTNL